MKQTKTPATRLPDSQTPFEEPGQDESGKTAAPQSKQGLKTTQHAPADTRSAPPAGGGSRDGRTRPA